jgi:hypothetical protein
MAVRLLHASITVQRQWRDADSLVRLLRLWQEAAPDLLPTVADDHEPVRRRFDPSDVSGALGPWSSRVWMARRKSPPMRATFLSSVSLGSGTAHFTLPAPAVSTPFVRKLESLVLQMAAEFGAEYAMIHALCDAEVDEALSRRRPDVLVVNRRTRAVDMATGFPRQLVDGLPTVYWTNLFGVGYERALGLARLNGAPWASIERHPAGILARVSDALPDDRTWPEFKLLRDRVIDAIGVDAFWPAARRVPAFAAR